MKEHVCEPVACGPSSQMQLPDHSREALSNGAVVYYYAKRGLPLVSFLVVVKGGEESDPVTLPGLSAATAALLDRGTHHHTATEFADAMDTLGGTFRASSDEQSTRIAAEFLTQDFDAGFGLFAEALLRPALPLQEVRKTMSRRADLIRTIKDRPGLATLLYARSFFFGAGHPYGRLADDATYERMGREDVLDYHTRMYVGRNMTVVVAGDFDPNVAKARVTETFGQAPAGTPYAWVQCQAPGASNRVLLVDCPHAAQTYFTIALPGVDRQSPERVTLTLVNTLIGGRATGLLNQALRFSRQVAYGAFSVVDFPRLPGAINITTFVHPNLTAQAIDIALGVLRRIGEQGFTAEQLASAKTYVKARYAPNYLQTPDQIAATLGELELFGLGRDEVDQHFQRIDTVTLEQANAAARKYYKTTGLVLVLMGKASSLRAVAARYGTVTERSLLQAGWA